MKNTQPLYLASATRHTIGRALLAGALCWSGLSVHAQNQPPGAPQQVQPGTQALLTQDDLKELLGPIALYPDALIALILPASTVPSDVVLGSRYVEAKGDPSMAGNQPWDDSVKSLAYYPDVLTWMNENLEWTASVGEAFMDQPADVMNAIQSLRAQARASGALADTPQQKVVVQEEMIRIIPADPEVIYVPQYDPEVIFVDSYSPGYTPFITFGFGFAVGSWMNYDCDWGRRGVYRGDWIGWNRGGRGWDGGDTYINNTVVNNTNVNVVNINNATQWNPSNRSRRQIEQRQKNGNGNVRFTTAEARATRELIRTERRDNKGKLSNNTLAAARRDALPNPGKLKLNEAAFNRTAKAQARDNRPNNEAPATEARKDRDNRPNEAAPIANARQDRQNATPNSPTVAAERQELRRKTPTEAPRVKDQIEAPRQVRKSDKVEEPRRDAPANRQAVRQQTEERQNNVPNRQTKVDEADRPSERPSIPKRQTENRPAQQNYRTERPEQQAEKPRVQEQVRQQQPKQVERKEARQEPKRQEVRQNVERPQQKRPEANPQPKQENRSANRPQQQQQQAQPKQEGGKKKAKDSDDSDKKKKD